MTARDPAIDWLLASREPAIRYRTLREVLGRDEDDDEVVAARSAIPEGPKVREIFAAQNDDGTWGNNRYGHKFTGTEHVLKVLADFRVPGHDRRLDAAVDWVHAWLVATRERGSRVIDGRVRWHVGARDGVFLDTLCLLGRWDDPRVADLVEFILSAQWPDGGWNCDKRPGARHSSFIETAGATRGLFRYHGLTGDRRAFEAAKASTEVFLRRGLLRSERSGELISGRFTQLHWPRGYDMLVGLDSIAPGGLDDPRLDEALTLLAAKRRRGDGTWKANGPRPPVVRIGPGEVADFCDGTRDQMTTLRALGILRAAGRMTAGHSKPSPRRAVRRRRTETIALLLADAGRERSVVGDELLCRDEDGTYSRLHLDDGTTSLLREFATTSSMANRFKAKEEALLRSLGAAGLPTPRVLASIDGSPRGGGDAAALLLDDPGGEPLAVDGRFAAPADVWSSVASPERDSLWATVGAMLRRLHDVDLAYAGILASPPHAETGASFVNLTSRWELGGKMKLLRSHHPHLASPIDELLGMRAEVRAFVDARPRAIRHCRGFYLPGLLVEPSGRAWVCRGWLSWGYYAHVGDPVRDVVALDLKARDWTGAPLPSSFYDAYGERPDELCTLLYETQQRNWSPTFPRKSTSRAVVAPYSTAADALAALPGTVARIRELLGSS
jgi:hypothetical protein